MARNLDQRGALEQQITEKAQAMNNRFRALQLFWRSFSVLVLIVFLVLGVNELVFEKEPSMQGAVLLNEADIKDTDVEKEKSPSLHSEKRFVYLADSENSEILTSIPIDADYQVLSSRKGWLQISLDQGVPVWVAKSALKQQSGGRVLITSDLAFTYSNPHSEHNDLSGVVYRGDELRKIRSRGDWVRVWSPKRFSAWIKDRDSISARS